MSNIRNSIRVFYRLFFALVFCAPSSYAGFLEMPDISEMPEYERNSLLKDLDIPEVEFRDPDPEGGPRINVTEFRLQGIVEFPKLGITRQGIIERIEKIRFDVMKEGELDEWGLTRQEVGEIAELIADIEHETQREHVGSVDVQRLVFLVREQRRKRGVTIGMIETVADTITTYYREKGFILAKAYVPKQQVRDGVVILTLLLGELGEVSVENNKRVSERLIRNTFKPLIDKPVTDKRIEEALYLINDTPGLTAKSLFSPGSQVGDTRLTVDVVDEKLISGNVRLDNHGSKNTSENRAYIDLYVNNFLGIGDQLYFAALKTYSPDNSTYGAFRYNTFVYNPRINFGLNYSSNAFESRSISGGNVTVFTGESEVTGASMKYLIRRSRAKNISVEVNYSEIETTLDTLSSETENNVDKTSLLVNFDVLNENRRHLYFGNLAYHFADMYEIGGFDGEQSDSEQYLSLDFSMLSFPAIPFTDYKTRLLFNVSGQYVGDTLPNLNQMSLTGPGKARGFDVNALQVDDGVYLGADWLFRVRALDDLISKNSGGVIQPYVSVDYSYGILHPLVEDDVKVSGELSSVGAGIKFSLARFNANVSYTKAIADDVDGLQEETPRNNVFFEFQYSF